MNWSRRARKCKRSSTSWRLHEESGQRHAGAHDRLGRLLCVFRERGATHVGAAKRAGAAKEFPDERRRVLEPGASYARQIVGAQEKNRHCAVPAWRAGFAGSSRAIFAEFISRSRHHSAGAAGNFAAADCQVDFFAAEHSGSREVRGDWAALADWATDGAATAAAGRGGIAV